MLSMCTRCRNFIITMGSYNLIILAYSLATASLTLMGILVNHFENYLPSKAVQLIRYGKYGLTETSIHQKSQVPKSYYKHFYVYASLLTLTTISTLAYVFTFKVKIPSSVYDGLDLIGGSLRQATVSNSNAMLAMMLFTLQCCRRFYETHFISIFGKSGRLPTVHYIFGFIYYSATTLAIILESPKFVRNARRDFDLTWMDLGYTDAFAVFLFLWAWVHQLKVARILANLRKDKKGNVVTETHKLPRGDWFEYVSSPHYLAEIIMYFALTVILRGNTTWIFVFLLVLANQVEAALLTHWWYKDNFTDFPKNRKAIIPFVY
ncbi:hypothetical protein FQR65_LT02862 [Abscondita terminalis]|nr:hypothetical protein FQR65_LT02862 [Abscondita terminalis]